MGGKAVKNTMKFKSSGIRIALALLALVLLAAGLYFLTPYVLGFLENAFKIFLPFILGYLFSLMINPLADKLQKKLKLPRGVSAILVIILTVGIVGGIVVGLIWKIIEEFRSLYSQYPQIYSDMTELFKTITEKYSSFYQTMPDNVQTIFDSLGSQLSEFATEFFGKTPVVERAGNFAKALPGFFIAFIVFFLSLYFMVADAKVVRHFFGKVIPTSFSEKIYNIGNEMKKYMGGYVKAQGIIMSIAFVVIFIGLSILGVDYALIIAIGIAVFDALPFFGSGAILWPWALISFLSGSVKSGVGLMIIYFAIVLTRQMVEPKIVSSSIGLHPILTLMSMYVGYKTFSIGGMILGPVTLMLVISFYKAGVFDPIIRFLKAVLEFAKNEARELKNIFIK